MFPSLAIYFDSFFQLFTLAINDLILLKISNDPAMKKVSEMRQKKVKVAIKILETSVLVVIYSLMPI